MATSATGLKSNIDVIASSLAELAEKSQALADEKEGLYVYDVHGRIDQIFPDPIDRFVNARESMIHAYSMQQYADLMNHFAAGERSINRVWSASVDGYIDEVKLYLDKAADHFTNAHDLFKNLEPKN
jgi:hypothetical protein